MTRQKGQEGERERKASAKMYLLKCEMYVVLVYFEEDKEKGSYSTKEKQKKQEKSRRGEWEGVSQSPQDEQNDRRFASSWHKA